MPRFSRGASRKLRRLVIDSVKNMQSLDATVATLTASQIYLAQSRNPADLDDSDTTKTYYVENGCEIKFLNIQFYLYNRSGNLPGQEKVAILVRKNPSGALPNPTLAQLNAIGAQDWRNYVFYYTLAKPPAPGGIPMIIPPIKIPKRYQRMQKDDRWEIWIGNNASGSVDACGICIYKWYR